MTNFTLALKIVTEHITIKQEKLTLTNQRAVYWKKQNDLILSDIHIGKTAHFRRHGIPMPDSIRPYDGKGSYASFCIVGKHKSINVRTIG